MTKKLTQKRVMFIKLVMRLVDKLVTTERERVLHATDDELLKRARAERERIEQQLRDFHSF